MYFRILLLVVLSWEYMILDYILLRVRTLEDFWKRHGQLHNPMDVSNLLLRYGTTRSFAVRWLLWQAVMPKSDVLDHLKQVR